MFLSDQIAGDQRKLMLIGLLGGIVIGVGIGAKLLGDYYGFNDWTKLRCEAPSSCVLHEEPQPSWLPDIGSERSGSENARTSIEVGLGQTLTPNAGSLLAIRPVGGGSLFEVEIKR